MQQVNFSMMSRAGETPELPGGKTLLGMVAFLVFAGSPKDSMVTSPANESTSRSMSTLKIPRAAHRS
jgi:hypothetical protein